MCGANKRKWKTLHLYFKFLLDLDIWHLTFKSNKINLSRSCQLATTVTRQYSGLGWIYSVVTPLNTTGLKTGLSVLNWQLILIVDIPSINTVFQVIFFYETNYTLRIILGIRSRGVWRKCKISRPVLLRRLTLRGSVWKSERWVWLSGYLQI